MKKSSLLCLLLFLSGAFSLTSCNDSEDDSTDKQISSNLPGTWVISESQTDESGDVVQSRNVTFTFTSSDFNVVYKKSVMSTVTEYSVSGTWDVKDETLELCYDINSFQSSGLTYDQQVAYTTSFNNINKMVKDLEGTNQAYGMPIELVRSAYSGSMKLSGTGYFADYAGTYTLSSESISL